MESESTQMNSREQTRFRIQDPNSRPRNIKVIALDAASEAVVGSLAARPWQNATFLSATGFPAAARDFSGQAKDLTKEAASADLVVMVASPGGEAHAASVIGETCSAKRITTTGLLIGATTASQDAVSMTLAQLRPWSLMLVVAEPDDYIADMLAALRA
jgi:hypothetical protein